MQIKVQFKGIFFNRAVERASNGSENVCSSEIIFVATPPVV